MMTGNIKGHRKYLISLNIKQQEINVDWCIWIEHLLPICQM